MRVPHRWYQILIAAVVLLLSGRAAHSATNSLSSVAHGTQASFLTAWKCSYQGVVTTTQQTTTVNYIDFYNAFGYDSTAGYLAQQQGNTLNWDYNGESSLYYSEGAAYDVYTRAGLSVGPDVDSNTVAYNP